MKFVINAGQFAKCLRSVVDVATKGTSKDWEYVNNITLRAMKDEVVAIAHGGTASIIASISDKYYDNLGYSCETDGITTVNANDLMKALNAYALSGKAIISASANEFKVILESDADQFNTMSVIKQDVKPPVLATKFDTEITVNRETFMDGIAKVQFAMGVEETKPYYKCILFEAKDNKSLRFAAGSGARFAVVDVDGDNIVKANDEKIIFPDLNIANIVKALSFDTSENITIKFAAANVDNNSPDQIVIQYSGITMAILGIDTSIKYNDVNKVMSYSYPNIVKTDLQDWVLATASIEATYTEDSKASTDIFNTDIKPNFKDGYFEAETSTKAKAKRKIKFTKVVADGKVADPTFRCNSQYLCELVKQSDYKQGEVEFNFEDKARPIVVKFPTRTNEIKKTEENFLIFFATSKR